MKSMILVCLSLMALNSYAAPLEAVECKKEMIQSAFYEVIDAATGEEFNSSNFSLHDFRYSEAPYDKTYDYIVIIEVKSRAQGALASYKAYGVKLDDAKTCEITTGEIKE